MPNHVTNRIEIIGTKEQIKEVFQKFNTHVPAALNRAHDESIICRKKDTEEFNVGWFNEKTGQFTERVNQEDKIQIGLPDEWEMEIDTAVDMFPDFNKVIPQPDNIFRGDLGQKEEEMCRKEGRPTWYNWNIDNWGTKWGGYSYKKLDENVFQFETAWSSVPKIIEVICEEFPDIELLYEWSDEDFGYNCGSIHYKDGKYLTVVPEGASLEAYEIGFKLQPEQKKYYKLEDGNYEYIEEED